MIALAAALTVANPAAATAPLSATRSSKQRRSASRRRRPCLACDPTLVVLGADAALMLLADLGVTAELFPLCRRCKRGGVVYLLHFLRPYRHARHYLGWTRDLPGRLSEHEIGRGARLMQVITEAGIEWRLARLWPGGRREERRLKGRGGASRSCPLCGVRPLAPRQRGEVA